MSIVTTDPPTHPCVESISGRDAYKTVGIDSIDGLRAEFNDAPHSEAQAALNLRLFTGLVPRMHDRDKRQGAADIHLQQADGGLEIVEVTSTIEHEHEGAFRRSKRLAELASETYTGTEAWLLLFQRGWSPPRNTQSLQELAANIACELEDLDARGLETGTLKSAPWLNVLRHTALEVGVHCGGWDAGIPDGDDTPYLDRLTSYLAESQLMQRKLQKLLREAASVGSHRLHLYLHVAIIGAYGRLRPYAPADLESGRFAPPTGLTDLWLDTSGEQLYHWSDLEGWRFHQMRQALSNEFFN